MEAESGAEILEQGTTLRIVVRGPFTFATYPLVEPALKRDLPSFERVVFDLRAASMIDSSAVGFMLVAGHLMREGTMVEVLCSQGPVLQSLQRMNMDQMFDVNGVHRE